MSVHVIYIEKGRKKMRPITTEEEYRALRAQPRQKNLVQRARGGDKDAKRKLLQMNYSCLPGKDHCLKGCTTPSSSVGMDVDFEPAAWAREQKSGTVRQRIVALSRQLGLLMLERSVSKGYHLVFLRRRGLSQEENLRWASSLIGVPFDEGAKDITRVFFTTTNSEEDLIYLDPKLFCAEAAAAPAEPEAPSSLPAAAKAEPAAAEPAAKEAPAKEAPAEDQEAYLGIPYSAIVGKWWELHYQGRTPVKSNRDVMTYELALNLRHICGFDAELLQRVIPCYDGFGEDEKRKCILSALEARRTQMPRRLAEVIEALRNDYAYDPLSPADDAQAETDLHYYRCLPSQAKPMGIRESIEAAHPSLAMPVIAAVCPVIGGLATEASLMIHGNPNTLNLTSYICGAAGSGKGSIDPIVAAWCQELQEQDDLYHAQHDLWRTKYKAAKNKKDQPEEPKLPIRLLTLNNTLANLAERLANTEGRHSISFTPEADTVSQKWKSSISDFSVMLRQAYDASRYDREARSAEAVSVHIPQLKWNVVMCGTRDALYRVVTNYTDGLLSRMAIARTPDNTFQQLDEEVQRLRPEQADRIRQVAHLLPLMKGCAELPKLERHSRDWVEQIRLECVKNDDPVKARCRMRDHVTAYRMTACIMLCAVAEKLINSLGLNGAERRLKTDPQCWIPLMQEAQSPEMLYTYTLIADSLIENDLYFFRSRLQRAQNEQEAEKQREHKGANDTIYALLGEEFDVAEARRQSSIAKETTITDNQVYKMLSNWCQQGLVVRLERGRYRKL